MRRSLRMLSWNVLADAHALSERYPDSPARDLRGRWRRRRVLERIQAADADVVALQEVDAALLAALRAHLPDHGLASTQRRSDGLAVLVRGQTSASLRARRPEPTGRTLLVDLPGGVTVASVHLKWSGAPHAGQDRPGLAQLAAVLDLRPTVIAGDWNAEPGWPERRLARDRGWQEVGPSGPTCWASGRAQAVDAVLVRGPWQAQARTLPRLEPLLPLPSAACPSDHLPLVVELRRLL